MVQKRSLGVNEVAGLVISWIAAVMALISCCKMVGFVSNQNGLARAESPNCTALKDCEKCKFAFNVSAILFGSSGSPEWERFRTGLWHDVLLLVAFGLQHSIMAADWFKNALSWSQPLTRTAYVGASVFFLELIFQTWVPIDVALWCLDTKSNPYLWWTFTSVHSLFWVVLCGNLLILDVGELFGVRQLHCRVLSGVDDPARLKSTDLRRLHKHLRHPGLLHGVVFVLFHPVMTYDRIVLGAALVCYFLARSRIDEDDVEYADRSLYVKQVETSPKKVRF